MIPAHAKTGASAPVPRPLAENKVRYPRGKPDGMTAKSLAESQCGVSDQDKLGSLVIEALWATFPEEYSEEGISEAARPYFRNKNGDPISARTIRYWLRGETLPSALHLAALVRMQPKIFLTSWLGITA